MTGMRAPDLPWTLSWASAVRTPREVLSWSAADWERVIRVARRLRLLARLAEGVHDEGLIDDVPAPARRHLLSARRLSQSRTAAMSWAVERVMSAWGDAPYPRVLLKGAAYLGQALPIARGRMPSDLDVLVPRDRLADAGNRLKEAGWVEVELDGHDQRYYHEWSHEVPPMRHSLHALELDLHHNILPPLARRRVDPAELLAHLQASAWPGWQVLHPLDQILHSAAHLFLDAELRDRLRDLLDLDGLMRHFGTSPSFWTDLVERARQLDLVEPLALAACLCRRWLRTPIAPEDLRALVSTGLPRWRRAWLLPLMARVLAPTDPDREEPLAKAIAAMVLSLRHHRQRLPLRLLVPHVWHKLQVVRQAAQTPIEA